MSQSQSNPTDLEKLHVVADVCVTPIGQGVSVRREVVISVVVRYWCLIGVACCETTPIFYSSYLLDIGRHGV